MFERIAIVGGGAIGSSLAVDMHLAGYHVELVDQWPAHVEAIRAGQLRVMAPDGDRQAPVDALHVSDLAARMPVYDLVFLACKGYDTRWMATLVAPYLADDGVVVVAQNGMTNDLVADVVGRARTVGAVVELSAALFTPGLVERDTARAGTWFALGELDGRLTPRLEAARDVLATTAKVDTTGNIEGAKWSKLVVNSATMGSFGILGLQNGPAARLPGMLEISMRLGRETVAVGDAAGIRMEPILGLTAEAFAADVDEVLATLIRTLLEDIGEDSRTAPVHDHGKGRRSEELSPPVTGFRPDTPS
jgi:2-dehydropantoate 2-reductase